MMGTLRSSRPLRSPNLPQVVIFTAGSRVVDALRPDWSFFPDENGNFDLAPLPPGKYYLATLLYNGDLDVGLVFYPGTGDPRKAAVIELGEGEQKQGMDFTVGTPRFHKRKTCCEFKIKLGP
jgi:hypothetical protein